MRILSALSALALVGFVSAQSISSRISTAVPVQTFFVPMPEEEVFEKSFLPINLGKWNEAVQPITSIVALAISTNGTLVWYDHWEDGYDSNVATATGPTTEIWGDGDTSNGCQPHSPCLKPEDDVLHAGQSIVIETNITIPRNPTIINYDGRDRIQASFSIAITRGEYPSFPGAYMAGAVEVYDTEIWGYNFEAPFGVLLNANSDSANKEAYERTVMYIMAGEDGTDVTLPNGTITTLAMGEGSSIIVDQGDQFASTKPIQAHIATADLGSTYELRWYSIIATEFWSNRYLSPVGDSVSHTKLVVYNPHTAAKKYRVTTRSGSYDLNIAGKSSKMSQTVRSGDGALVHSYGGEHFMAVSQTDTVLKILKDTNSNQTQNITGDDNDWGFPLMPVDRLTSQVLIGWGYGCSGLICDGTPDVLTGKQYSRNVVWVSCIDHCDIYVDYDNDGVVDEKIKDVLKIKSTKISDPNDHDMSGAIVWATTRGTNKDGLGVGIAVAWGQDPTVSAGGDLEALDLGTVVLPFPGVRVTELVDIEVDANEDGLISPGDTLKYTIRIQNMRQTDIAKKALNITGPVLAEQLTQRGYIPGTCRYNDHLGQEVPCADDSLGSKGLLNPFMLPWRGGFHDVTFLAKIDDITKIYSSFLPQGGKLRFESFVLPFGVNSQMIFNPDIKVYKTVHHGDADCDAVTADLGPTEAKSVSGYLNSPITYCYKVENTGSTMLASLSLSDFNGEFSVTDIPKLGLGGTFVAKFSSKITGAVASPATVTGTPVFAGLDSNPIPELEDVTDEDIAAVFILSASTGAQVELQKTVHLGHYDGCPIGAGSETQHGYFGEAITYCYEIKNIGLTHLENFRVTDDAINFSNLDTVPNLAPGESYFISYLTFIRQTIATNATVYAHPIDENGDDIATTGDVMDIDPAGVKLKTKQEYQCTPDGKMVSDGVEDADVTAKPTTPKPTMTPTIAPSKVPTTSPTVAPTEPPTPKPVAATPFLIFQSSFDQDDAGLTFKHDTFGIAVDSGGGDLDKVYAVGGHSTKEGGVLSIELGGVDYVDVVDMSGGFFLPFTTEFAGDIIIKFRTTIQNHKSVDAGEDGYVFVTMDGKKINDKPVIFVEGKSGSTSNQSVPWTDVTLTVSGLEAGDHEIVFGGLFTGKTTDDETVEMDFDDIQVDFSP